jgi:taurine dioxygenase
MVNAYKNLSDNMREMIDGMRALHSGMATFQRSIAGTSDARPIDKSEIKPPQSHPIVRLPSGTNQQAIFVNPHFTTEIEDVSPEEGYWMLNHMNKVATQPENIYRHQWRVGDVLVWDNRRTMHYAVRDYTEDMPRKLHRCTAQGEIPV